MLYDNHGRVVNYLRLAVTDRCNLRCFYCMPEDGIEFVRRQELLTYEEMLRVVKLLVNLGVEKVRITGGEPFVRKGLMDFLEDLSKIPSLKGLHLTTNGTMTAKLIPKLKEIGVNSVNLSLDTMDETRFLQITRRDTYHKVMTTFRELIDHQVPTKLNMVVMAGKNIEDIVPMVELTKEAPVDVRFLEEMPFNGEGKREDVEFWDQARILVHLKKHFPLLQKIPDPPHSTAQNYQLPGHLGKIGIIASYSRLFCGSCNRLRLTPTGVLKTCLYDNGIFNIRDMIRNGADDTVLTTAILDAIGNRAKDGFEAEARRADHMISESMATIGG